MSLFELAKKNKLPLHQFIDFETIEWINLNKPNFKLSQKSKIELPKRHFIERFVPEKSWFLDKREIDSIHGLRHLLRTIIHSAILTTRFISCDKKSQKIAMIIASIHDIGRKNDKDDLEHGKRSAAWFRKNVSRIEKKFRINFEKEEKEKIYWAIFFHGLLKFDSKYKVFYKKFKNEINIIKAADALDRFRLPKIKWWINEKMIDIKLNEEIKDCAFNLVVKSEMSFLNGQTSINSVIKLLK